MLRSPKQKIPIVAAAFPPLWQVWRGLAELEALGEQRVREDLLSDTAEQLDAVERARGALLRDGVDDQGRVWKF